MRLRRLTIQNFRCYQDPFSVEFDDLTAIIGRNDVGKSAIMDALAIFFEEGKLDSDDGNVAGDKSDIQITCEFDDIPAEIDIDEGHKTNLTNEKLLNGCGRLEIIKTYDGSGATGKLTSTEARCEHPTAANFDDLLELKRADLINRAKILGVDLSSVNKKANAPIRDAIRTSCPDLQLVARRVSLDKEGGKQIWTSLKSSLPAFALFKADRASTDQDSEAQDPLKAAIREAIKSVEADLVRIQSHVEAQVNLIAEATVEKLREMDPSLAEGFRPVITTGKWDSLFRTSIIGDHGIPLNKRGSGVKRLVLLNFFRAKAERAAAENNTGSVIYAIEEPETSQHPRNQRMLMSALTELSATPGRQVIVTTHTPMLARALALDSLRFIERDDTGKRKICEPGQDTHRKVAESLGVLPDHSVKLFLGVEGKHDISFLKGICRVLLNDGVDVPDLETLELEGRLIFFPFGGSNLALWASKLAHLNRPEFHICDRDNPPPEAAKYQDHIDKVNARHNCFALATYKREMENYLHPDAICEAYRSNGTSISLEAPFADFDDVPKIVAQVVHDTYSSNLWNTLNADDRRKSASRAKCTLNGGAVANMTAARLSAVDPSGEVLGWLEKIKSMLEAEE
jgi:putative ATP-dependent endonuclease of the OLD family